MTSLEKYNCALKLLREINCPEDIMAALEIWGMFVRQDDTKLKNWQALSQGGIVEGEYREIKP